MRPILKERKKKGKTGRGNIKGGREKRKKLNGARISSALVP